MVAGSITALRKRRIGSLMSNATGSITTRVKTISAIYRVASNLNRLARIPKPMCPTVYAIAAPTAKGAKSITTLVNLNITSVRLSQKLSMFFLCGSLTSARPMAKRMLKTTICNTWPSAIDLAMFSGKMCRMVSSSPEGGGTSSFSVCPVSGNLIPTPAWLILMATSPMRRASVVTISK